MADSIELLTQYGLTRPEAKLYVLLLTEGQLSGYEAAKRSGLSRSNVYTALSSLVEKGAAVVAEEQSVRYQPISFEEFSDNFMTHLQETRQALLAQLPKKMNSTDNYVTIRGRQHVKDKFRQMLKQTEYRVYLSASADILLSYHKELQELLSQGKKVVLLTKKVEDISQQYAGATIYAREEEDGQIRLITDSAYCLTGTMAGENETNCLFTSNANLVQLMKDALSNEIKLIELERMPQK